MKELDLVKGIQYSHELLAKVSSVKNYVKQMRQVGEMSKDEFDMIQKQVTIIEGMARDMIIERETRFERAGGMFTRPENIRNEFHTTNRK